MARSCSASPLVSSGSNAVTLSARFVHLAVPFFLSLSLSTSLALSGGKHSSIFGQDGTDKATLFETCRDALRPEWSQSTVKLVDRCRSEEWNESGRRTL